MNKPIMGLDPGLKESSYVILEPNKMEILRYGTLSNNEILNRKDLGFRRINSNVEHELVIEMLSPMGQITGHSIHMTAVWIGVFAEAFCGKVYLLPRMEIKMILCGRGKSGDSDMRKKCIEMVGPKGTKKEPGPTYGLKTHMWQALAAALAHKKSNLGKKHLTLTFKNVIIKEKLKGDMLCR